MKITTRPQTYIKSWVGLIVRRGSILDVPIYDINRILQEETATIVSFIIQNRPCLKVIMNNRGFHEILPLQIGSPIPTQSPAGSSNRGMNLTLLLCASLRNPICRKESQTRSPQIPPIWPRETPEGVAGHRSSVRDCHKRVVRSLNRVGALDRRRSVRSESQISRNQPLVSGIHEIE